MPYRGEEGLLVRQAAAGDVGGEAWQQATAHLQEMPAEDVTTDAGEGAVDGVVGAACPVVEGGESGRVMLIHGYLDSRLSPSRSHQVRRSASARSAFAMIGWAVSKVSAERSPPITPMRYLRTG